MMHVQVILHCIASQFLRYTLAETAKSLQSMPVITLHQCFRVGMRQGSCICNIREPIADHAGQGLAQLGVQQLLSAQGLAAVQP